MINEFFFKENFSIQVLFTSIIYFIHFLHLNYIGSSIFYYNPLLNYISMIIFKKKIKKFKFKQIFELIFRFKRLF